MNIAWRKALCSQEFCQLYIFLPNFSHSIFNRLGGPQWFFQEYWIWGIWYHLVVSALNSRLIHIVQAAIQNKLSQKENWHKTYWFGITQDGNTYITHGLTIILFTTQINWSNKETMVNMTQTLCLLLILDQGETTNHPLITYWG